MGNYYPVYMQQPNLPNDSMNQHYGMNQQQRKGIKISAHTILVPSVLIIIILLVINIVLTINPPYLAQKNLTQQVTEEVAALVQVNPFENPVVSVVADAESLRKANSIQAEVYANANNGDYVLGFSDKMVIYRRETGEIIYQGESPGVLLNKNQQALRDSVVNAAVSAGLISQNTDANPQMSVVTDPTVLQKQDPEFYAKAKAGDIIAIFAEQQLILLVRTSAGQATIVERGVYNTQISRN
ncbi:hypothetical protein H3C67_00440 [Candidatus Dojkabacteria bacterium]|uniref:Uncharacterized protein n=1 Tax=Candidatus Dojkabacteria bacterium TaxID=2099670 RepID=A0A952AIA2_9BACT|nr:hypothetical protein [Candidatus Dojkabacteria bacterium]